MQSERKDVLAAKKERGISLTSDVRVPPLDEKFLESLVLAEKLRGDKYAEMSGVNSVCAFCKRAANL